MGNGLTFPYRTAAVRCLLGGALSSLCVVSAPFGVWGACGRGACLSGVASVVTGVTQRGSLSVSYGLARPRVWPLAVVNPGGVWVRPDGDR